MIQIVEKVDSVNTPISYKKGADKVLTGILLLDENGPLATILGQTLTADFYPEGNKGGTAVSIAGAIDVAANGTFTVTIPDTNTFVVNTTYNMYMKAVNGATVLIAKNPIALKVS